MSKEKTIEDLINEFFSDPKHQKESTFLRAAVKKILKDEEEERKKNEPEEEQSFLSRIFDGK